MLGQQLLNGLVAGAGYALFALGFTLMFGVLRVINLVYGVYFAFGAFLGLFLTERAGMPLGLALPLAVIGTGLLAIILDSLLLTRLRHAKAPELSALMVTLGATLLLYALMAAAFGTEIRRFPHRLLVGGLFGNGAIEGAGLRLSAAQALLLIATPLILAALGLVNRTGFGLKLRALAENPEAAALMGVNTNAVIRAVSFLSGGIGALAGLLTGLNYNAVQPYMGEAMMLKGFAVIIIGGLGDIGGAVIAGLLVGLLESLTAGYLASSLRDAAGFVLLVLTLWCRPNGLFGQGALTRA